MLGLVVDGPLAAAGTDVGRVDADPAIARTAPVGDARPADAVLHLDVEGVAAAVVVEVMAGVGEVALPGVLEPGGHLLGLGVGVNPVSPGVGDAVFGARGGGRVFGVPDPHGFVDAADWKRAGDALVEGDAVDDRAARAGGVNASHADIHGGQVWGQRVILTIVRRNGQAADAQHSQGDQPRCEQSTVFHSLLLLKTNDEYGGRPAKGELRCRAAM